MDQVELTLMDRWILSRLHQLIKQVDDDLSSYRFTEPANAIETFVDDLSNWYIRRGRERFWGKGMDGTKEAAFATLYTVLVTFAKVIAPFVPFIAEDIYQNLVRSVDAAAPESIHLTRFPVADESLIDEQMNAQMATLLDIVSLGRACRNVSGLQGAPAAQGHVREGREAYGCVCVPCGGRAEREGGRLHQRRPRVYYL